MQGVLTPAAFRHTTASPRYQVFTSEKRRARIPRETKRKTRGPIERRNVTGEELKGNENAE